MCTSIVIALRETDGIRRVEVSLTADGIRVVLTHDRPATLPPDITDQVEAREGSIGTETIHGVPRWVIVVPVLPLVAPPATDDPAEREQAG